MKDDDEHKAYRTYACVAGVVAISILNRLGWVSNDVATQLITILIALAVAALRYGQVQDAKKVKTALEKQQEVVKEAIVQAEDKELKEKCR